MITYKTCATNEALTHNCDPCNEVENGGVRSVCLIKSGTEITIPLNLQEWTAAVEAGNIIIIPDSRGTFDGGTPKMGNGYGNRKEKKLGDDFVLAFKDPSFAPNSEFWADAEKIEDWNLAWRTDTQLFIAGSEATLTSKSPVEEDIESEVVWNVEAKWFSKNKPSVTPFAPVKSLFKCFEITE